MARPGFVLAHSRAGSDGPPCHQAVEAFLAEDHLLAFRDVGTAAACRLELCEKSLKILMLAGPVTAVARTAVAAVTACCPIESFDQSPERCSNVDVSLPRPLRLSGVPRQNEMRQLSRRANGNEVLLSAKSVVTDKIRQCILRRFEFGLLSMTDRSLDANAAGFCRAAFQSDSLIENRLAFPPAAAVLTLMVRSVVNRCK